MTDDPRLTQRPDPAEVIAKALGNTGRKRTPSLVEQNIAVKMLAALKDAGFLLLHENDKERLIEAVQRWKQTHGNVITPEEAVAAVFGKLGESDR